MTDIASYRFVAPQCLPGEPIFAVGDVHGQSSIFERVLRRAADALESGRVTRAVFLGDIIDRGPDSLKCLRLLAAFRDRYPSTLLMGNHEQCMLTCYFHECEKARKDARYNWRSRDFGGSWGLDMGDDLPAVLAELDLMPEHWGSAASFGNVIFVHAGVPAYSPKAALPAFLALPALGLPEGEGTSFPHWAWIREGFLEEEEPVPGRFVVHGHTRVDFTGQPLSGRVNLDASGRRAICSAIVDDRSIEMEIFGDGAEGSVSAGQAV